MATLGSRVMPTGLALTMIAVGAGVASTSFFGLLLSFVGVLAGSSLIFVGVRIVADDPTAPTGCPLLLAASVRVRALVHCLCRNLALVGLLLASSAASATAAAAAAAPVLCFCAFALMLLGLSLLNIGVLRLVERELEH